MDIATQTEVLLREAGYDTWAWNGVTPAVICFENAALIGFAYIFGSANDLLRNWQSGQNAALTRHGSALRTAGAKAWNVYSVFLTEEQASDRQREIERIEEDFTLTRKIARAGIRTQDDLERSLLPLTAIRSQPLTSETDFEDRLRTRLKDISPDMLTAFLGTTPADELARFLTEEP